MSRPVMTRVLLAIGVAVVVVGLVWAVVSGLRSHGVKHDAEGATSGTQAASRLTAAEGPSGVEAVLTLAGPARARAGIVTQVLVVAARSGEVRLTGELIADPGRTITVQAPVPGRLVTVDAGHWPALGERVEAGAVLGQISDAKPLTASRGGTVTRVGAQPGQAVQPGQELLEVTDFAQPLARIVWRADVPLPAPATLTLAPLVAPLIHRERQASDHAVRARLVGRAAGVDSLTRFPVYLYRAARGWPGAAPGTSVIATVAGTGPVVRGVFVPAAAVVQWEGLSWVYVGRPIKAGEPTDRSQYVREPLDTTHPADGGWVVTEAQGPSRLVAGDRVVVRGAQQLLSEEFRSRAVVGDGGDTKDEK